MLRKVNTLSKANRPKLVVPAQFVVVKQTKYKEASLPARQKTYSYSIVIAVSLFLQNGLLAQENSGRGKFLQWGLEAALPVYVDPANKDWSDLEPLGEMIGNARIVSLTEPTHGIAEPLKFRNRMIEYLIDRKGFTTVAIESGMTEGQVVHDYVRGGLGDIDEVVAEGISWTFDQLPANKALVKYLRSLNEGRQHKVNFYGFDVSGSPSNARAKRPPSIALEAALNFLDDTAPKQAEKFRARIGTLIDYIRFDRVFTVRSKDDPTVHDYTELGLDERLRLSVAVEDIIDYLEWREIQLIASSSERAYQWAYRNALSARQVDSFLRKAAFVTKTHGNTFEQAASLLKPSYKLSQASRDRAQADNIEWILNQEGADAKLIVYAHRNHLMTTGSKERAQFFNDSDKYKDAEARAGWYLKRQYGRDLITVWTSTNSSTFTCPDAKKILKTHAGSGSFDALLADIPGKNYVLDFRRAPIEVQHWLKQDHLLNVKGGSTIFRDGIKIKPQQAFDLMVFMRDTTSAAKCSKKK